MIALLLICVRVADSHHFNADPKSAFHFNADLDPAFDFNAVPDPAHHQRDGNLRPLVYRPSNTTAHFEPPGLHYECLWTFTALFEPLKLLNFDLYAEPDPGQASKNNADPKGSGSAILSEILRLKNIFFTFLEELLLTMF